MCKWKQYLEHGRNKATKDSSQFSVLKEGETWTDQEKDGLPSINELELATGLSYKDDDDRL
jgi:hypothetical protein